MLRNYLKVTLRNFSSNKLYASLNTLGLSIAFAAFILIGVYLHYETHFENFHTKASQIYRPTYQFNQGNGFAVQWARIPVDYINELPREIPEIKTLIRFQNHERKYVRVGEEKFRPDHAYVTDKEVFEVFDFKLLEGNPVTALAQPNSIVITESVARQYFGNAPAMGKDIFVVSDWSSNETRYVVTGVMADVPPNTHLPVDILFSYKNAEERSWWAYVYTLLEEGASIEQVEAKMDQFISKYESKENAAKVSFEFQPLSQIHLHSNLAREIVPNSNALYVKIFFFIAFFILVIALINFINLSSAMSIGRSKEVGVRTILGAGKKQIVLYSLSESVVYNLLSVMLGALMAYFLFPYFKAMTEVDFILDPWKLGAVMVGIAFICGLISGIYPSLILTSFNALEIIKHSKSFRIIRHSGSFNVKRMMVTVQFGVSILLIGSALVAYQQFQYINEKNLGLTKDQILAIPNVPDKVKNGFKTFKDRLSSQTGILGVSACMEVPSREIRDSGPVLVQGKNADPAAAPTLDIQIVDPGFAKLMDLQVLAGNDGPDYAPDYSVPELNDPESIENYLSGRKRTYLINETAMKQLGWDTPEEAVGQEINFSIGSYQLAYGPVTGVVKDYNQETLKNKVDPLIMTFEPIWIRTFLVKAATDNIQQTIEKVQATWDELFPAYPLEYHFLDELYENLYKNERVQLQLLYIFSGLAIFIAFMGLFSLIAYSLKTRVKEIAIRRVLGADLVALIQLIGKEYLLVLIIGSIMAVPISYFMVNRWLQNFAYRIDISLLSYAIALILIGLLLLVTVSFQTLRSTSTNPADTLRDE